MLRDLPIYFRIQAEMLDSSAFYDENFEAKFIWGELEGGNASVSTKFQHHVRVGKVTTLKFLFAPRWKLTVHLETMYSSWVIF